MIVTIRAKATTSEWLGLLPLPAAAVLLLLLAPRAEAQVAVPDVCAPDLVGAPDELDLGVCAVERILA